MSRPIISLVVLMSILTPALADDAERKAARERAAELRKMAASGEFEAALAVLRAVPPQESKSARAIDGFSLALLYEDWAADSKGSERIARLKRATASYEGVLKLFPGNGPAALNVSDLHLRLGNPERSVEVLERVAEANPEYRLKCLKRRAGILDRQEGRQDAAHQAWARVLREYPKDADATRANLRHLRRRHEGRERYERLLAAAGRAEKNGHLAVAARTYESIVHARPSGTPDLAIVACERWVLLRVKQGPFGPGELRALPPRERWRTDCRADLDFLTAPPPHWLKSTGRLDLGFWNEGLTRRQAAAAILRDAGLRLLQRGDGRSALRVLEEALALSPEYRDYRYEPVLKGAKWVRLDVVRDLVRLYESLETTNLQARLDALTRGVDQLVDEMFVAKSAAIMERDYEAMHRFHATLGLIYHRRGEWGDERNPRSAVFQLKNAISAAARAGGPHPPLFGIHRRLGDSYVHAAIRADQDSNRPDARRFRERAAAAFLDATQAALDIDDLERAAEAHGRSKTSNTIPVGDDVARRAALKSLIDMRATVAAADGDALLELGIEVRNQWTTNPHLDADFLARQRFKALSDLGTRADELGQPDVSIALKAHGLHAIKDQEYLVGGADRKRYQDAQRQFDQLALPEKTTQAPPPKWNLVQGHGSRRHEDATKLIQSVEHIRKKTPRLDKKRVKKLKLERRKIRNEVPRRPGPGR